MRVVVSAGLTLCLVLAGCSKKPGEASAPPMTEASASQGSSTAASQPPARTLLPLFASAADCLAECISAWWGPKAEPAPKFQPVMPLEFAEVLAIPEEHARFIQLVELLPQHLHPLGKLQPRDEEKEVNNGIFGSYKQELPKMHGSLYNVLTNGKRTVYVYSSVAYFRLAERSTGRMHVAIDPESHEQAAVVRAGADLDEYYIVGAESLRSTLLAFTVASDLETADMLAHYARKTPGSYASKDIIFPLHKSRDEALIRVQLLNDRLGEGQQATGVPAPDYLQQENAAQAELAWYGVSQGRDKCIVSPLSPAQRIDLVKSAGVTPAIRDTMSGGKLTAVEVSAMDGNYERVWRFFKRKEDCERTLASSVPTPDKYR